MLEKNLMSNTKTNYHRQVASFFKHVSGYDDRQTISGEVPKNNSSLLCGTVGKKTTTS